MIDHSEFRKWAEWQEQDQDQDVFGHRDPDQWTTVLGQRCKIERLTRYSEKQEAGKETAKAGIKVTTRYRAEIAYDRALRILHKGVVYDIEDIENVDQQNRFLVFYATTTEMQPVALAMFDGNILGDLNGDELAPI